MLKEILLSDKHVYRNTAIFSLLTSLWLLLSNELISRDSILYIQAGQAFLDHGLVAAFQIGVWPFYSIIFAILSHIIGLKLEYSAYVFTVFFELMVSLLFVRLYSRIAIDGARLWVAALFVLTFVTMNNYKGDIIREYGYWAFSLMALYQFVLYYQERKKSAALLWQVSLIGAFLFRVEGIVFAVLAPLFFLFEAKPWQQRITHILRLNSIFIPLLVLALAIFIFSSQVQTLVLANLPIQAEYLSLSKVFANFNLAVENFIRHVLPFHYSAQYSHLIIGSGLLVMLAYKLIMDFGIIYVLVWYYGIKKKWLKLKPETRIIYLFMGISLVILLVFITSRLFVSTRYLVMLLLFSGLIFSQYLDYALRHLQQHSRLGLIVLTSFIGVQFLDGMISTSASKMAIKTSGEYLSQWLEQENIQARIACNEVRFTYYSDFNCENLKPLKEDFPTTGKDLKQQGFSYLLIWVKSDNTPMLEALAKDKWLHKLKAFSNRDDDQSILYQIRPVK